MKSNEILKAIGVTKNKFTQLHCTKLAAIYILLKEIKNEIVIAEITESNIEIKFGLATDTKKFDRDGIDITNIYNYGEPMTANKITVLTEKSEYSFAVPVANDFYYVICDLLGLQYEVKGIENIEALRTFEVSSEILNSIKKAAKFASKDGLRPAMTCVCLDFNSNDLQVVATNAHRLYLSKQFDCEASDPMQLLLSPESVKMIAGMKVKDETIKIELLPVETHLQIDEDTDEKTLTEIHSFLFNGLKCQYYPEMKFPNYKVVIPELKSKMTFDRVQFVDNVKSVYPSSNKCTGQVNFHLNGNIQMSACDIDFGFECAKEMSYINKNFIDTDIAFNGKFLIEGLNIFKSKEISMYSEGNPSKAAIFTDEVETVLLMPLLLNN